MRRATVLLFRSCLVAVLVVMIGVSAFAQTKLVGVIYDSSSEETLAGVSVRADGSQQGTSSGADGSFQLVVSATDSILRFALIGYRSEEITIQPNNPYIEVFLTREGHVIDPIEIRRKGKYNRRNPAVALIDLVIDHKSKNKLSKKDDLYYRQYEKIKFGLVDPNPVLQNRMGKMNFFFQNVDKQSLPGKDLLTLYMEERLSDNYNKQNPERSKKIIRSQQQTEFNPKYINNHNIQSYFGYIFQPVDIYDESIFFINKQFLSPIADNAKIYYKYFLVDTVKLESGNFARLRFEPFNSADLLFQGELMVSLDGRYAVKEARMRLDEKTNINWVNSLNMNLSYSPDAAGVMLQDSAHVLVTLGRGERNAIFGERMSYNSAYDLQAKISSNIFSGAPIELREDPSLVFSTVRPIALDAVEQRTYRNVDSLNNVRSFNTLLSIGYLLSQSYYSLGKVELGPLEYAYQPNKLEGNRFRLGGRTTAEFSNKTYLEGYVAYGTRDQEFKFYTRVAQALNGRSIFDFPAHYLEATVQHDVFDPGRNLGFLKGDSFFQGIRSNRPSKWLDTEAYRLGHVLEFGNHISIASQFTHQRRNPIGDLKLPLSSDPNILLTELNTNDLQFVLRWAPRERFRYRNLNRETIIEKNPVFNVQYNKGLDGFWSGNYEYDALRLSVSKRWFMNQLGFGDMTVTGGKIWGTLPYPLLELPTESAISDRHTISYDLINSMEFVADRFLKFAYDHQLQGYLLNKIPGIKWFKLREIMGTKMFYGRLSEANNPYLSDRVVHFDTDEDGQTLTYPIGTAPYWEGYVGLDNVFRILRVQYFYRYNYLQHRDVKGSRIKVSLKIDF